MLGDFLSRLVLEWLAHWNVAVVTRLAVRGIQTRGFTGVRSYFLLNTWTSSWLLHGGLGSNGGLSSCWCVERCAYCDFAAVTGQTVLRIECNGG